MAGQMLDQLSHQQEEGAEPEPMPSRVSPMLALASPALPDRQDQYGFEYKWDGVRAICFWDGRALRLQSRNLLNITNRYPELDPLGKTLGSRSAILDGEIVALDARGHPDFGLLQPRMHLVSGEAIASRARSNPALYMIFDLLYLDGGNLMAQPYEERRHRLEHLHLGGRCWRTPPYHVGAGSAMLEAASELGVEGVVAKRLGSKYQPGRRSGAWLKIKLLNRQEFVIGGWLPEKGLAVVGALLAGYYDSQQRLRFAGRVGTGFSSEDRVRLTALLDQRRRSSSPFSAGLPPPKAFFVEPELVAEIEFLKWTRDGILRQPSFKGLRDDKDPRQVVREMEVPNEEERP